MNHFFFFFAGGLGSPFPESATFTVGAVLRTSSTALLMPFFFGRKVTRVYSCRLHSESPPTVKRSLEIQAKSDEKSLY